MSKKNTAVATKPVAFVQCGAAVPRRDSTRALWAALCAHPDNTTAALADIAGIGLSTARRLLARWETAGHARQHTDPDAPRAAKTWTQGVGAPAAIEPDPALTAEPADPEPVAPTPDTATETAVVAPTVNETATPAPEPPVVADDVAAADAESTVERLPAGALRGQVEDHLRDHPGIEFTPHQIGKALDRSSGAVHNALIKLTDSGIARQTSTAPKRFTLAS
ncbi:hypothetical protein [Nocardia asteroides]|uniref:hypothetical protein n=1 Tax=Nocardia asteroides TaxID=1824 RepID=UPI001E5F68F1|nr:hypothetical protein [Nocardia asteroides]UGT53357.1 hypothetical protein LTT85_22055 [Nocardia asteroides]